VYNRAVVFRVIFFCPFPSRLGAVSDMALLAGHNYKPPAGQWEQVNPVGLKPFQVAPVSCILALKPRDLVWVRHFRDRDFRHFVRVDHLESPFVCRGGTPSQRLRTGAGIITRGGMFDGNCDLQSLTRFADEVDKH
jgi:hypothetical protein